MVSRSPKLTPVTTSRHKILGFKNTEEMSNSFEINAKADEWLDITSKEEVLQNELDQTKENLETRSMELLESNVTIDLLKGHKTLLENERDSLQDEIQKANQIIEDLKKQMEETEQSRASLSVELADAKKSFEQQKDGFEDALRASTNELQSARAEINSMGKQMEAQKLQNHKAAKESGATIARLEKENKDLKLNIQSLQKAALQQKKSLAESQDALQVSQRASKTLRAAVSMHKTEAENAKKQCQEKVSSLGKVSMLADDLKSKNNTLARSTKKLQEQLEENKKALGQSQARESALKEELRRLKTQSEDERKQMEEIVSSAASDFAIAKQEISTLQSLNRDTGVKSTMIAKERDELKESLQQKEQKCQELSAELKALQTKMQEQAEASSTKGDAEREQALEKELGQQRATFERRLKELHSILGVSPMSEIKAEISTATRILTGPQRHFQLVSSWAH